MIKKVDHIAIVVKNLDDSIKVFEQLFNLKPSKIETVQEQGVKAALFPIGKECELELLQPIDAESGIAKFLEAKGEGIHHICLEVDDVDKELQALEAKGARLIDKKGRYGLAGRIGFIHPKSVMGTLIELAQKTGDSHH